MVHYDLLEALVAVFDRLAMAERKEVDYNLVVCHLTLQRLTYITIRDLHLIILRGGLFSIVLISVFIMSSITHVDPFTFSFPGLKINPL